MPTFVDDDSSISNKMPVSAAVILCVNVWAHNYCTHCAYGKMQVLICQRPISGFVCIMWSQMVFSVADTLFQRSPRLLLRLWFSEAHLILRCDLYLMCHVKEPPAKPLSQMASLLHVTEKSIP